MYLQDDILQESVTYQGILNKGVTKGVGLGEKTEAIALISRLLKKRFGDISETIKPRLNTLSIEQLELFGESLFDFNSFEDACAQRAFGIVRLNNTTWQKNERIVYVAIA